MKTSSISLFLSLLSTLTSAQTPNGFPIKSDQTMTVTFQSSDTTIKTGQLYPQQDVVKAPSLSGANTDKDGTYVAIMVDATYPYLHFITPNLVAKSGNGELQIDNSDPNLGGCPYLPPAPPASDGPHEYVVLVYEQPDGWAIPDAYAGIDPPAKKNDRSGFDVGDFVGASGLTTLVGSNWFRVEPDGSTATPKSKASPTGGASPSAASASPSATSTGTSANAASASQFGPVHWLVTSLLLLGAF